MRADQQWLAVVWALRNRAQLAACGPPEQTIVSSGESGSYFHWPVSPTEPDPTRGATHFHRHDEQPQWARNYTPIALIGDFLFYRLSDPI